MRASLDDLTIRTPTLEDAQRTLDLMVRCDVSEYGESDSDLEDLLHDWSQIALSRDAWLAFTPAGDLVGYGAVVPWGPGFRYDFYVDPSGEGEDLGRAILARCEERGLALVEEREETAEVMARTYVAHVNQRNQEIVRQADFRFVKYHFQMQVQMDSLPPEPRWPEGIVVRTVVPDQDDREIHELIESAFYRPGRTPLTFEQWKAAMLRTDIFEAGLWFLVVGGGEIVGACLCFEYPGLGWVRQLGVAEAWRRQGLGTALLLHAFSEFKRRGLETVGLVVDSDNPKASILYQEVGMRQIRQYDEYEKPIVRP